MQEAWVETPFGGSPEAERLEFERLAREIMRVQLKTAKTASAHGVPHGVDRALRCAGVIDDLGEDRWVLFVTHGRGRGP